MTKLTYEQFQEIVDDCINKLADVLQEEGLFDMESPQLLVRLNADNKLLRN